MLIVWPYMLVFMPFFFLDSLKILHVPKRDGQDYHESSLARVRNPQRRVIVTFSLCVWISRSFDEISNILKNEENGLGVFLYPINKGSFLVFDTIWYKFPLPEEWHPESWAFLCFSYHDIDKEIHIYWNSIKVFEKMDKKSLKDFSIGNSFLEDLKIGEVKQFSGNIAKLDIWSKILTKEEIEDIFNCKTIQSKPDILDWENTDFDIGKDMIMKNTESMSCINPKLLVHKFVFFCSPNHQIYFMRLRKR